MLQEVIKPGDISGRENRVRTPVKGLRAKLRTALIKAGFTGKFRTDHHRNGTLYVICDSITNVSLPIDTFENHPVRIMRR